MLIDFQAFKVTVSQTVTYVEKVAIGLYWCKIVLLLLQLINDD